MTEEFVKREGKEKENEKSARDVEEAAGGKEDRLLSK